MRWSFGREPVGIGRRGPRTDCYRPLQLRRPRQRAQVLVRVARGAPGHGAGGGGEGDDPGVGVVVERLDAALARGGGGRGGAERRGEARRGLHGGVRAPDGRGVQLVVGWEAEGVEVIM